MRKLILFISILAFVAAGCNTSKELASVKSEKTRLESSLNEAKAKLSASESALSTAESKLSAASKERDKLMVEKKNCEKDLASIKTTYAAYSQKLKALKAELKAAFPNNLNEPNFSIVEEDGRLIITLPNSILYARGKAEFDAKALDVIQKLTKVFRNNQGLQILVEGHTDDVPLKAGSMYKDNWDLSMARAVKIVRQFETYGVHPSRLTAAGRGYFSPKSKLDTEAARTLNRRTEIIIRPKFTELLKLIDDI